MPADTTVEAAVGIGPRSDKGFGLAARLAVTLPGIDRTAAAALIVEADTICLYSHATRGNIAVDIRIA